MFSALICSNVFEMAPTALEFELLFGLTFLWPIFEVGCCKINRVQLCHKSKR